MGPTIYVRMLHNLIFKYFFSRDPLKTNFLGSVNTRKLSTNSNLISKNWRGSTSKSKNHLCSRTDTLNTPWRLSVLDGNNWSPPSIGPLMKSKTRSWPETPKASLKSSSTNSEHLSTTLTNPGLEDWLLMNSNLVLFHLVTPWVKTNRFVAFLFFFKKKKNFHPSGCQFITL